MKSIFGGLLEFESQSKLNDFVETIDEKTSMKIIENSMEYGMKSGLYSLEEAFCLYKCLLKIKSVIDERGKPPQPS